MSIRWVPTVIVRDAVTAGVPEEVIASWPVIAGSGNPYASPTITSFIETEIVRGQKIQAAAARLRARGLPGADWGITGLRPDVILSDSWAPLSPGFNLNWVKRISTTAWNGRLQPWLNAGWTFRWSTNIVPGFVDSLMALQSGTVPLPYCAIDPVTKTIDAYAFVTDASSAAFTSWLLAEQVRVCREVGSWVVGLALKTANNENWPSYYVDPSGVHCIENGVWTTKPIEHPSCPITIAHYQPGQYLALIMDYIRALYAAGIMVPTNEAWATNGVRWLWEGAHPDVADMVVGECSYQTPWLT